MWTPWYGKAVRVGRHLQLVQQELVDVVQILFEAPHFFGQRSVLLRQLIFVLLMPGMGMG